MSSSVFTIVDLLVVVGIVEVAVVVVVGIVEEDIVVASGCFVFVVVLY